MTSCSALAPGGAHAFHRARFDGFHGFGEQLGEHAGGADPQRQHAGEGAKADGDDEEHGEDHLVDRPAGVHQPAHRLVDPPGHDVLGAENAQRDGADDRQQGAPEGDVHRGDHLLEVQPPVAEVRREEVGGKGGHVGAVANQQQRIHLRALPGPGQHGQAQAPAEQAQPAALVVARQRRCGAQSGHVRFSKTTRTGAWRRSTTPGGGVSWPWRRFSARARPCAVPAWPVRRRCSAAWPGDRCRRAWRRRRLRCAS